MKANNIPEMECVLCRLPAGTGIESQTITRLNTVKEFPVFFFLSQYEFCYVFDVLISIFMQPYMYIMLSAWGWCYHKSVKPTPKLIIHRFFY